MRRRAAARADRPRRHRRRLRAARRRPRLARGSPTADRRTRRAADGLTETPLERDPHDDHRPRTSRPRTCAASLRADVRAGLTATPKTLPPKYFYDARGSELFEDITRLPEYYQTRAEASILAERAAEIADLTKARHPGRARLRLLGEDPPAAAARCATSARWRRYVPVDVSADAIEWAMPGLVRGLPRPRRARRRRRLRAAPATCCPRDGPRLVAFLGGTIGNFEPAQRRRVPRRGRRDRCEPRRRAAARHRPGQGPGAAGRAPTTTRPASPPTFNLNVLHVITASSAAPSTSDALRARRASGTPSAEWIEMRLRSHARRRRSTYAPWTCASTSRAGEEMRTEISAKFRRGQGRRRADRGRAAARALVDRRARRLRALAGDRLSRPGPA